MSETEHLFRRAQDEIVRLREQNRVLSGQMFVVEAFHAALLGRPGGMGMSPDIVWEIDRHIQAMKPPTEPEPVAQGVSEE